MIRAILSTCAWWSRPPLPHLMIAAGPRALQRLPGPARQCHHTMNVIRRRAHVPLPRRQVCLGRFESMNCGLVRAWPASDPLAKSVSRARPGSAEGKEHACGKSRPAADDLGCR
jgi:hypothetical protein